MEVTAGTVFLWVASVVLIVLAILVGRMVVQLRRTLADLSQLARSIHGEIVPRVERTLDEVSPIIAELRDVAERANNVVARAEGIATKTETTVNPILDRVTELTAPLKYGVALLAGIRAGWDSLRRGRHGVKASATE